MKKIYFGSSKKTYSVRSRMTLLISVFLVSLLAVFLVQIIYSQRSANQRILETVYAGTSSRIESITNSMAESALSAQQMAAYLPFRSLSDNPSEWFFYYKNLQSTLNVLESNNFQYANIYYFAYNYKQDYFLKSSIHPMPVYDEEEMAAWLRSLSEFPSYSWQTKTINGTGYFIYGILQGDFYSGVFLSSASIQKLLSRSSVKDTVYAVYDPDGQFLSADERLDGSGAEKKSLAELLAGNPEILRSGSDFWRLQRYPTTYGFTVVSGTLLPGGGQALLSESPYLLLLVGCLFLFVPLFYLFMKRELVRPLNYLRFGFSRVSAGDLSFRGQQNMFSDEFNDVIVAFNSMLRQIRELRMNYYEEKILQQQAENRYLRAISYPHFLLNNLNLINNFAYEKNEEGIHAAVMNLSSYLRYFITADASSHTLKNDVESARCYLNLNCLAYPGRITYTFDADEKLMDWHFPPLIISTIVENCIKHGLVPGRELSIDLVLKAIDRAEASPALVPLFHAETGSSGQVLLFHAETESSGQVLLFRARNNGPSFPQEVLDMVNSPQMPSLDATHIGLAGVKQTLKSQFQDHCIFQLQNDPEGVTVLIEVDMQALRRKEEKRR